MTVNQIVQKFLEENGFDGLFNEEIDCACKLDDLIPCDYLDNNCTVGYLVPCDCYMEHEFHIVREKP